MNFSKLTALITFAIVLTLSACLAKKEKAAVAARTDEASSSESKKAEVEDGGVQGGATGSESGNSDFDIEQLMKLIDALKNQNFDEIDETLKGNKLMNEKHENGKSIADMIKEDEAKMAAEKSEKEKKETKADDDKTGKNNKSSDREEIGKKSEEEFDDRFEL